MLVQLSQLDIQAVTTSYLQSCECIHRDNALLAVSVMHVQELLDEQTRRKNIELDLMTHQLT